MSVSILSRLVLGSTLAFLINLTSIAGAQDNPDPELLQLQTEVKEILKNRCYQCHGGPSTFAGLDVTKYETLTAEREEGLLNPFITPNDVDASDLFSAIDGGGMPLNQPELPPEELAKIREWIEKGAGYPPGGLAKNRPFITHREMLEAIRDHLNRTARDDRENLRFFSLTHLHNNRSNVDDYQLKIYKASLAKVINSLSRRSNLLIPVGKSDRPRGGAVIEAVDEHETIYAVDLRQVGWELEDWEKVLAAYPYGLRPRDPDEEQILDDIQDEYTQPDGVAHIRADWFIVNATRPPLYHCLLQIPKTLGELEEELGVDRKRDFDNNLTLRGGMINSNVSAQNRLVDRHESDRGSYWISYDFIKNSGTSNLARFPLGPIFKDADGNAIQNGFNDRSFVQDGGEIIFRLPNGLQAYMLIDGEGNRINAGPIQVVWDEAQISGTPEIVTGLSCMVCHYKGTITFKDDILEGHALFNANERRKVESLYRHSDLSARLKEDGDSFSQALRRVMKPVLSVGEDADKDIFEFAEPVERVVKYYSEDLGVEEVAAELGMQVEELQARLNDAELRRIGFGPLRDGGTVKRTMIDSREGVSSPFQEAARILDIGIGVAPPGDAPENDDC